jgi:hypothetical protein
MTRRNYKRHRAPQMSRAEFANWGTGRIAYVRPSKSGKTNGFTVHTADGRKVGFAQSYGMAAASILQHDLYPMSVH